MSTQESPISERGIGTGTGSGSPAEGQTSAAQQKLEEIQLARLGARLRQLGNTRDVVRALGEDPDEYASRLAKQYAELSLKQRETTPFRAKGLPSRLTATLDQLGNLFNRWESVVAPNATVGLTQAPSANNTGGVGIGASIYQGDLALAGDVWNTGTQEQWWVNTWQYIVPLPPTPATYQSPASLSYRFNVGASVALYRQDVVTGSVHVYATVATTNDLSNHPIDFNQPASSDFAIVSTLPTSSVPPILSGTAKITGTIPLSPGRTPAIGIIIGLIISAADGDVQIIPGEYSSITLAPPDATMPGDLGKIEYRRDQPFWVEAVAKMLTLNINP